MRMRPGYLCLNHIGMGLLRRHRNLADQVLPHKHTPPIRCLAVLHQQRIQLSPLHRPRLRHGLHLTCRRTTLQTTTMLPRTFRMTMTTRRAPIAPGRTPIRIRTVAESTPSSAAAMVGLEVRLPPPHLAHPQVAVMVVVAGAIVGMDMPQEVLTTSLTSSVRQNHRQRSTLR